LNGVSGIAKETFLMGIKIVVASDNDGALEGRFPAGGANLSATAGTADALNSTTAGQVISELPV